MADRKFTSYHVENIYTFKIQMLNWAKPFNIFCLLDNHQYNFSQPAFDCLLAAGSVSSVQSENKNSFHQLEHFINGKKDWIFGHLNYDLKNEIESLTSENIDGIGFPELFFFVPRVVLILKKKYIKHWRIR